MIIMIIIIIKKLITKIMFHLSIEVHPDAEWF